MTSWNQQSKNSSSFSNQSKNSTTYTNQVRWSSGEYLLKEDGSYLLQEDGYKIFLDQSVTTYIPTYSFQTKN